MNLKQKAQDLRRLADEMLEALGAEESKLPESWEDLSYEEKDEGNRRFVNCHNDIMEAMIYLNQLYDLRQAYWAAAGGWEPDWTDNGQAKFSIRFIQNKVRENINWNVSKFLAFPTRQQRDHFLKHHIYLIEQAKPLL